MKLKSKVKIIAIAITSALAANANATTFHNQGAVLGYGDAANNHTLFANFKNPAYLAGDDTVRKWGLGFSAGIDAEFKNVKDMDRHFEQMQTEIETDLDKDKAQVSINDFLSKHDKLSINAKGSGSLPLVVQTTNYGGYMLAASYSTGGSVSMVRDGQVNISANPTLVNGKIDLDGTNAGLAFNTFQLVEFSASYALDLNKFIQPTKGHFSAGIRAKLMQGAFNQYVLGFDKAIADRHDFTKQAKDGIKDTTDFKNTKTQLGLDLGVQYVAKNYLVGLSIENINSPSFKYNQVASSDTSFNHLVSKKIKFEPKGRIEGALYSENRRWTLAAFADLNKTSDITGLDTQKAGVSASYSSTTWWMPEVRVGYIAETEGNKMDRTSFGLTAGFLNLDVAANSFNFDENKETSVAANISVEFAF